MANTVYSGRGFSDWEIGDVDVLFDGELFHLFHLIIPNHDYIAHAISKDGINWERTKNAIHVGDPGEWDDDMLWTMHTTFCSETNLWRMFYTGLCLKEHGAVQRVGCAVSEDLYFWTKDESFEPIESTGPFYESVSDNPRGWLSFRDPFYFNDSDEEYLLVSARCSEGSISRRGCTGLLKNIDGEWKHQSPLVSPGVYDDMECPCVLKVNKRYYLIASIREDRKVRYWYSKDLNGPYKTHASNTLLPQGNFAGRILQRGDKILVFSFFFVDQDPDGRRALPPPRELKVGENNTLYVSSYSGWDTLRTAEIHLNHLELFCQFLDNKSASVRLDDETLYLKTDYENEFFTCSSFESNYIWEGELSLKKPGKCGLILNLGEDGSGYFISLDVVNGFAQLRAWGVNEDDPREDYIFRTLQSNHFTIDPRMTYTFKLINYGSYIEFSLNDRVILSLVDYTYTSGELGVYCSCTEVALRDSSINLLRAPSEDYLA